MITLEQLKVAMPASGSCGTKFIDALNSAIDEFQIITSLQQAAFIAQVAHECSQFRTMRENLNYSAQGLMNTFPSHFSGYSDAQMYERKPQAIASRVYAFRNGNGGPETSDGWSYRGGGAFMLTGRANYRQCGQYLGIDLEGRPEMISDPDPAMRSAGWFWAINDLNDYASDIVKVTKVINGGHNGLAEREAFFSSAKEALGI